LDQGVKLVITCDTGVDAFAAIDRASLRGCDVIVTDHHDLPDSLPPAVAVINPKRLRPNHPLRGLPGVGVAYKLVEYMFHRAGRTHELEAMLDLVALGVVADIATQVADVRYLLQRGLEVLRTTGRVGLRALVEQAELRPDGLTEEHISYQLAPRLNALGRLGDAGRGVELLLTQDLEQARILSAEMDGLNYRRRLMTSQITQAALAQVERAPSLLDYRALVVAGHDWHLGVLGVVAGRLAKQFERPAVVLSLTQEGIARGSARSVPGCDIHAALKGVGNLLLRYGGHPHAAGLSLDPSNLESFRKAFSRSVESVWDSEVSASGLQIDAYVTLDQLSLELVEELERLAPFGPGNPSVQLATRDLYVVEDMVVGRDGEHRRLVVTDEQGTRQTVLWWQGAGQSCPEGRFDLAYALRARDYRGEMQLQVEWVDARSRPAQVATLSSSPSARVLVDHRDEVDPHAALAELHKTEMLVWAEGPSPDSGEKFGGRDRLGLGPSPELIIWTAPPGPEELAQALQIVNPTEVYLFALEPATAGLREFLERLVGMVKYDLQVRDGQVNLRRLAAALGHREATVRVGVEWLAARGQVHIVETDEDTVVLEIGGEPSADADEVKNHLQRLLEETAAYRRHFRSAPIETLGIAG
jgi:single-stranded-DNA-specific exonuclease